MITKYNEYIRESTYVDYFTYLYNLAPQSLKDIINSTEDVEQSKSWHPEGNVLIHIRLVTNRLGNCFPNDKNLLLSGFFHDLGKVKTTEWNDEKQSWSAHGHEDISSEIVDDYKDWIIKIGGNPIIIKNIVYNHMKIKYLDELRLQSKIDFLNNPNFDEILKFNSADYGGTELECKPIQDLSIFKSEIEEYNKKQEINKIISDKFNGRIIMDKYPSLSGKELGTIINNFKNHIIDIYGDYNNYMLNNSQEDIFQELKIIINNENI